MLQVKKHTLTNQKKCTATQKQKAPQGGLYARLVVAYLQSQSQACSVGQRGGFRNFRRSVTLTLDQVKVKGIRTSLGDDLIKTKARFSRLLRHPAWKWRGPILISALHKSVTYLLPTLTRLLTAPGPTRGHESGACMGGITSRPHHFSLH